MPPTCSRVNTTSKRGRRRKRTKNRGTFIPSGEGFHLFLLLSLRNQHGGISEGLSFSTRLGRKKETEQNQSPQATRCKATQQHLELDERWCSLSEQLQTVGHVTHRHRLTAPHVPSSNTTPGTKPAKTRTGSTAPTMRGTAFDTRW